MMSNPHPVAGFKKGKSGNPKGRPKAGESLTDLMREYLSKVPEGEEVTRRQKFIEKTFEKAQKNNDAAMKLVWNYLDGMPTQKVEADVRQTSFILEIEEVTGPEGDDAEGDGPEA